MFENLKQINKLKFILWTQKYSLQDSEMNYTFDWKSAKSIDEYGLEIFMEHQNIFYTSCLLPAYCRTGISWNKNEQVS